MKTLKIGKKEFTVLNGNEMFTIRQSLCSVMADLDFIDDHLLRSLTMIERPEAIKTVDDFVRDKAMCNVEGSRNIAINAFNKCKETLKTLRES